MSGVSSSLSGGGLAYGGLPSYTLHLGKRFMEHKSGGLPALPSLFCNGMEERSSLYSRCYSQCPRWDVLFPSTARGSLQVHALVKARIRVPYVSLNPEIVSKRRVHSAQTQMSSITLDSLAITIITIPLLPVWACVICDKCKSSTKTSLGAKLQGWISTDNCHRILVNPKDRRGSWR